MSVSKINISEFSKHIFWNYKDSSELNEEIVIDNIHLYGEMKDYRKLLSLVEKESEAKEIVTKSEISEYFKNEIRKYFTIRTKLKNKGKLNANSRNLQRC